MKAVIVLLALMMFGCAGFQQAVNGYEAAGAVAVRAADDNAIQIWSVAGCAFPLSAILRNPGIIPAIKALCTPSTLLDTEK